MPVRAIQGLQYFPQRFDLLAVAAVILGGAWGAGHLVLRIVAVPLAARSLERTVFAFGLGLATLSLVTLGAGLLGRLSRPLLAGLIAVVVVIEFVLRATRAVSTHGPTGGLTPAARHTSNLKSPRQEGEGRNSKSASLNPRGPILIESVPTPGSPNQNPKSEIPYPKLTITIATILAVPFLLAMLLASLLPSTDFDVNEYHFEGPKEFFQAGRISFLEHNVYTSFPFGTEMLTLLAMVLSGDWYRGALAGKCVLMCFGPLTALALLAAGRRSCFGRSRNWNTLAGVSAALLYLATPWVFRISTIAYAEGGLCFYLFAALLAVMIAIECGSQAHGCEPAEGHETSHANPQRERGNALTPSLALRVGVPSGRDEYGREPLVSATRDRGGWRPFLLAGLLAGSAMACKYPAALVGIAVVPLRRRRWSALRFWILVRSLCQEQRISTAAAGLVLRSPSDGGPRWSCAAGFGLGVLIAVGPWLVKNLIETGNPVYPLAYRLFDGRDWDAALDARWREAHSSSTFSPASLADLALDVAFRSTWVSPLLVGLAPWALLAVHCRRRAIWLWCYVGWLLFSCWLFTHRIDRFWVPLLPVLALLAGVGLAWCWSEFPRRWARTALVLLLARRRPVSTGIYLRQRPEPPRLVRLQRFSARPG